MIKYLGTGGAGEIRTRDLRFRKPTLYPSELQPPTPDYYILTTRCLKRGLWYGSESSLNSKKLQWKVVGDRSAPRQGTEVS